MRGRRRNAEQSVGSRCEETDTDDALRTQQTEAEIPKRSMQSKPYDCSERSYEESLMEMYLAGISVRRIEDIAEALWGCSVRPYRSVEKPSASGREIHICLCRWHLSEAELELGIPSAHTS